VSAVARMDQAASTAASINVSEPTVGFVQVGAGGRKLLGSGTLISVGESKAILTARAVVDRLPSVGRLGLVLRTDLNQVSLDTEELAYRTIDARLGLVLPSAEPYRRLSSYKKFLRLNRDERPTFPDDTWWINGFSEELTTTDLPIDCFDIVQGYTNVTAAQCEHLASPEHADIELTVSRLNRPAKPMAFDGLVGGGLWRVKPETRKLHAVFSGVVTQADSGWSRSGRVCCAGPLALDAVVSSLLTAS
jgi:hypothetical protein